MFTLSYDEDRVANICNLNHQCTNTYYVVTKGSDSSTSIISAPFATLNRARDAFRKLKLSNNGSLPAGDITVYIGGGKYSQRNYTKYDQPLLFLSSKQDSGQPGTRTSYSAYLEETVELVGGYQIPSSSFKPSSNNPDALMANSLDINNDSYSIVDYSKIWGTGYLTHCLNNRSENGKRMILSRWPNEYINYTYAPTISLFDWTNIDTVIDYFLTVTYDYQISPDRAQMWLNALNERNSTDNSVWLSGYWVYDWLDGDATSDFDPMCLLWNARSNSYDKYEPVQPENEPTLKFLSIQNLAMSYATQYAISAVNVANVNISNIKITGIGQMGLTVNGYNNIINGNHLTEIGCGGMSVTGGDELQLIRGNNIVDNNKIDHYAAWKRIFVPGITYSGVGDNYTNNILSDAPHEGVVGLGNNYLFDINVFMNLGYEVSDQINSMILAAVIARHGGNIHVWTLVIPMKLCNAGSVHPNPRTLTWKIETSVSSIGTALNIIGSYILICNEINRKRQGKRSNILPRIIFGANILVAVGFIVELIRSVLISQETDFSPISCFSIFIVESASAQISATFNIYYYHKFQKTLWSAKSKTSHKRKTRLKHTIRGLYIIVILSYLTMIVTYALEIKYEATGKDIWSESCDLSSETDTLYIIQLINAGAMIAIFLGINAVTVYCGDPIVYVGETVNHWVRIKRVTSIMCFIFGILFLALGIIGYQSQEMLIWYICIITFSNDITYRPGAVRLFLRCGNLREMAASTTNFLNMNVLMSNNNNPTAATVNISGASILSTTVNNNTSSKPTGNTGGTTSSSAASNASGNVSTDEEEKGGNPLDDVEQKGGDILVDDEKTKNESNDEKSNDDTNNTESVEVKDKNQIIEQEKDD